MNSAASLKNLVSKGLEEPLKAKLTAYQQPVSNLFKNISIQRQFHVLVSEIYENMPKIFYFTNYQRLEDSLTLTELIDNPSKHVTFVNFLKLAGIKTDYLKTNKDKVVRLKQYLTKRSGEVSQKIQKVYKQERVDFVIDYQNDVVMVFTCYPPNITNLLPPSAGNAGFQWYIGFYINFASHTNSKYQNAVLLLDDPGVLLHPSGHKDLLEELRDYTDKNITIIYSTYLPSLIPKNNFSAIRVVKKENMQTEIIENFWKLDKHDSWSPVRSVLGVDFTDSMIAGSKTLMVEGPADIIYLQGFIEIIEKQTKTKFDLFIIPLEGVAKSNFYITLFTSLKLPFIALVDDDHDYSDLPSDKIMKVSVKNIIRSNQKSFEIEDLLESEVLFKSLNMLYEDKFDKNLLTELKKNLEKDALTIVEDFMRKNKMKIKLDKVMLAKIVIRGMKINFKAHAKTLENFENMLIKIDKKIK